MAKKPATLIPSERIELAILLIRSQKVMLDGDLAALYGVEAGRVVRQVRRNIERFPDDFAIQFARKEFTDLKCQFGISSSWAGRRMPPWAFAERRMPVLSSLLRSRWAVAVNIEIMRTFVRLRGVLSTHAGLAHRPDEVEKKYDRQFAIVFDAIRQRVTPPTPRTSRNGISHGGQADARFARRWLEPVFGPLPKPLTQAHRNSASR